MEVCDMKITFRRIIRIGALLLATIAFILFNTRLKAQNEYDIINNKWLKYSDSRNSLYNHLTGEAYRFLDLRTDSITKLDTAGKWQKYQSRMRQTMWDVLGSFPEKTPLNAKITGKIKKDGYSLENVIYESLPGFYVTASLFIPDNVRFPAPAILFCTGHTPEAFRNPLYQLPILNLVKKGFIVLAFDPIGQGERLQYFDPGKGQSSIGGPTKEHSYVSVQVSLIGQSVGRYFVWDGIRGIDYLVSRKEVDPLRIGVHGLSGGGTQTAYISALDDRVTASAPACYITSFSRLLESIGVQDGEQNFYQGISRGIDHATFIGLRAPKPTLIMSTTRDFFSIQGARETFKELKGVYRLFGASDNIEMNESDFEHGYTKENREALYAFFQKHLSLPGSPAEEEVVFLTAQELQKTPTGQLSSSLGGETVFSLNLREAGKLTSRLETARNDLSKHLPEAVSSAKKLSGYLEPSSADQPVFTGRFQKGNHVVEKYFIKGEGDYIVPYLLLTPVKPGNKAVIYLHPSGKSVVSSEEDELEWLTDNGYTILIPDLIGTGETGPGLFKGDAYIGDVSYNLLFSSLLIGRSIVGVRASDVVKLARTLAKNHGIKDLTGIARNEMCPVMLHAAAFEPVFASVVLAEPYLSYESVVVNRFYKPAIVHSLVAGALTGYDLTDLAASLAPKKLTIINLTDANGIGNEDGHLNRETGIIRKAYQQVNAGSNLNITSWEEVRNNPESIFKQE